MTYFEKAKAQIFIFEDNTYGNSEPRPIIIDNVEYLTTFTNDDNNSYISLINVNKKTNDKIKIPTRIPPGFHSILYKKT